MFSIYLSCYVLIEGKKKVWAVDTMGQFVSLEEADRLTRQGWWGGDT